MPVPQWYLLYEHRVKPASAQGRAALAFLTSPPTAPLQRSSSSLALHVSARASRNTLIALLLLSLLLLALPVCNARHAYAAHRHWRVLS